MKIECVPHAHKSVMTIHCDGDEWRKIHTAIFGKKPALPEISPSIEEFSQLFDVLEYRQAKQYLIKRLSVQNMPSSLLSRSLRQRLVSDTTIERLIEEFCRLGYVNDGEWTKSFVRTQISRKRGPRAIAQKLACKGISKDQMKDALQDVREIQPQKETILQLLKTRYRTRDLSDFKEKQKVVASLVRRGFDLSAILDTLGMEEE